ncbi:DUF5659 domain-containing protein [Tengunoibacter tsumagoiensis]|uniref:DUF5659 domain-containing protein n=1 Tax=Tengunoibacter tsumagoiensis TaxID=2014871 RepID=A0A401ZTR6_9CHLR|nr:DUF5659 domain-containing protein [Tengunoibacter tsumagoiensis]GCE10261.1 hypothetical protein KTT_01200 [Tengunoibacter tsumagoiensis]
MVEVSDYWIAAYIMAYGVKLLGTKKNEDGWVIFFFDERARKAIERWNQGVAMIDARSYRSAIHKLRNAIYS